MEKGNLDEALRLSGELRDELLGIEETGLADEQRGLVADAVDMAAAIQTRIEDAIAIDDALHPEDR